MVVSRAAGHSSPDGRERSDARHLQHRADGGLSGNAQAISLSSLGVVHGGLLWFFGADNPELLVKILNVCTAVDYLRVFISAGTNVGVNLFIGDTDTGAVTFFHNPDLGPFPAIQNVFGIPCPVP